MPQESRSRRSFGYRSFISCEDPRGVAECGTVRKPKIAPTRKFENGKKHESDAIVEEAESPTSFHLLEVSKGAQKLNNVITSYWSAGHSKDNSKDMAQNLLKGALDLGESLAMLSRLQQSPKFMLESKKKQHKKKIDKGWFDDDLEMDENVGAQSHQDRRLSFDEMTRVIRDSRNDRNTLDAPSTSSSQSSVVHSGNFVFPEPFLLPAASLKRKDKKTKRSNLIAKLMGLEDVSSFSYNNLRKDKGDKNLKQKKTAFDLDSPIERKHEHDSQKSGWKRKPRLDNIVKAVEHKGVPNAFNSEFSNSKQKWGDADDILVLRPLRFSCLDLEQPIVPKSRAEVYEDMFVGMRIRNNPLAQTDEVQPLNFNENFGKSVKSKRQVKEAKANETASLLGNLKSDKKHIVEKNAQQPQKLKTSRGKNMVRGTKNSGNSEKNWPENIEKVVYKITADANGDQRYRDEYVEAMLQTSDSCRITEDASQIEITVADYVDDDQSSPSETSLLFGNQRNNENGWTDHTKLSQCSSVDIRPIEGGNICSKSEIFDVITAPCVGKVKALLVSDQSFIKSVEEVFDVKVTSDSHQIDNDIDHSELSARELLDTANELIGLYGSQRSAHKTISITRYCYSSLDQLLDEVCDEIEDLRRYRKDEGDDCTNDSSILLLVKRDLRTTGLVGGMWDMGWISACSADEIEEITRGVDELVLDGLLGEILVDLSL